MKLSLPAHISGNKRCMKRIVRGCLASDGMLTWVCASGYMLFLVDPKGACPVNVSVTAWQSD